MPQQINLETKRGHVAATISVDGGNVQLNVFIAPVGPGFFLVFPDGDQPQAERAAVRLIEGGELPEESNITARVPGALTAGTLKRAAFKVEFGSPKIDHAQGVS